MARIRTIKPEFWTSEQVVECSTTARLMFVGLWNFCDDAGRHVASCKRLKMQVFPGDPFSDSDIAGWVAELVAAGLIVEYTSEGVTVWQVTGWHHQKIDKPNPSKLPPPPQNFVDHSSNGRGVTGEESESIHPRKGMEGNGREGNGLKEKVVVVEGSGEPGGDTTPNWVAFLRAKAKETKKPEAALGYVERLATSVALGRTPSQKAVPLAATVRQGHVRDFIAYVAKVASEWERDYDKEMFTREIE